MVSDALGPAKCDTIVSSQCLVNDKLAHKGAHEKSVFMVEGLNWTSAFFSGCDISFVVDDKD